MQRGDISNETPARIYVIFEGLIATLPSSQNRRWKIESTLRRYRQGLKLWRLNLHVKDLLFNLPWRMGVPLDVVTFLPEECGEYLEAWLEAHGVPYSYLHHYESSTTLSRDLAHHPEVALVLHPEANQPFLYGQRGWVVDRDRPVLPA